MLLLLPDSEFHQNTCLLLSLTCHLADIRHSPQVFACCNPLDSLLPRQTRFLVDVVFSSDDGGVFLHPYLIPLFATPLGSSASPDELEITASSVLFPIRLCVILPRHAPRIGHPLPSSCSLKRHTAHWRFLKKSCSRIDMINWGRYYRSKR